MITFLGIIVFGTIIAIGAADRYNGLRIFQKYDTSPSWATGATPVTLGTPRRRQRRAPES